MPPDPLSEKDKLEYAWRYFELHAGQRLTIFNFFLVISGAAFAGLASALSSNPDQALWASVLGLALSCVSFVFWKLEERTRFLVRHAEGALSALETRDPDPDFRLVSSEAAKTEAHRRTRGRLTRMWTYGAVFRLVYVVVFIIGLICGALFAYKGATAVWPVSTGETSPPSSGFPHTTATQLRFTRD